MCEQVHAEDVPAGLFNFCLPCTTVNERLQCLPTEPCRVLGLLTGMVLTAIAMAIHADRVAAEICSNAANVCPNVPFLTSLLCKNSNACAIATLPLFVFATAEYCALIVQEKGVLRP